MSLTPAPQPLPLADLRFAFDVQGYLHLRGALSGCELTEYSARMDEVEGISIEELNRGNEDGVRYHLNRPVSRVLDADPRFACLLDHATVEPLLTEFLGADYRHIDNDLYYTYPAYPGGSWHRGVRPHRTGHIVRDETGARFICPMVKVFYCMTDVGPGEGEFVVVPGSHRAHFEIDLANRLDLPAQHVFDDVRAGDIILFNEGLLHNGRPNLSSRTRKTIIINLGRHGAGVWPGYMPKQSTLDVVTPRQRAILTNSVPVWAEPDLEEFNYYVNTN